MLKRHGTNLIRFGGISVEELSESQTIAAKDDVVATVVCVNGHEAPGNINAHLVKQDYRT